ncbi:MAG: PLP-dependent transferase, partial [Candidatus Firestonebacteria bacterium]|nr:PLP-dependent transferase [Candidatus Firestonebacteria bacterium]
DLIAGAVMTKTEELGRAVKVVQNTCGAVLGPNDCWLLLRGIKTLSARLEIQSRQAQALAEWLKAQPWVKQVFYPGLADHPGHEIIRQQAEGFGAVVSLRTDSTARTEKIMKHVKLWSVAVSLGGVESILSYPTKMSHAAIPAKAREALGISPALIRLSVGLEAVEDLQGDLEAAAK